jgi:hypothetical protein
MPFQIPDQILDLSGLEAEIVRQGELGPPEAVSAIGMTGLSRLWEEQDGLPVLVLNPGQGASIQPRHVENPLPGRVGIQAELDFPGCPEELRLRGTRPEKPFYPGKLMGKEHPRLRKDESEKGVVRSGRPVDEFIDDVGIHTKREHPRHRLHGLSICLGQIPKFRDSVDVFPGE